MKRSSTLIGLSALIAVLALFASVSGLLWPNAGDSFEFTTLRGETVHMYGRGLYRYDTVFSGAANRGTDVVSLLLGVPLLVLCTLYYEHDSLAWWTHALGHICLFSLRLCQLWIGGCLQSSVFLSISHCFQPASGPLRWPLRPWIARSFRSRPGILWARLCPAADWRALCLPADWSHSWSGWGRCWTGFPKHTS